MKKNIKLIEYARYELDENLNIVEIDKKFTELTGYTKKDIKNNEGRPSQAALHSNSNVL